MRNESSTLGLMASVPKFPLAIWKVPEERVWSGERLRISFPIPHSSSTFPSSGLARICGRLVKVSEPPRHRGSFPSQDGRPRRVVGSSSAFNSLVRSPARLPHIPGAGSRRVRAFPRFVSGYSVVLLLLPPLISNHKGTKFGFLGPLAYGRGSDKPLCLCGFQSRQVLARDCTPSFPRIEMPCRALLNIRTGSLP